MDDTYYARYKFQTSLTDNGEYPEFCEKANQDDALFKDFRRNEVYNIALEHDSQEQGLEYLEVAKKLKNFESHIEDFKKNDEIGNPVIFPYDQIGEISPTTIRYIKILSDIEREFGTLDNLSICEIGVGYGGLCRIIDSYFKFVTSYCLVDLKPVLRVAQKYLNHFKINTAVSYKIADDLGTQEEYDLVISNYAFTELRREVQDIYLKKVILNSKRGYITYNDINPRDFNSYSIDELMEMIPNMRVLKEIELTDTRDRILVWSEN